MPAMPTGPTSGDLAPGTGAIPNLSRYHRSAIAVPTSSRCGAKASQLKIETRRWPNMGLPILSNLPDYTQQGAFSTPVACPVLSLHQTGTCDPSLDQTRPVAHRQRALCVSASKQRVFGISPPPRAAQPRDGVAPKKRVPGAGIVSESQIYGTRSHPVP